MKVLLFSHDVVGEQMAGPGIRYWEMSKALADDYDVTLVVPADTMLRDPRVRVVVDRRRDYNRLLRGQDVCITQLIWPRMATAASRHGVRLVADLYDPILLEELAAHSTLAQSSRRVRWGRTSAKQAMTLTSADAFICASERQRDMWLGALMALERVTPALYDDDVSLRRFVEVVPFGLPEQAPARTGPGFRQRLRIPPGDTVLLWGGGIWNWFDPLSLIEAMVSVRASRQDVHLLFMGGQHPNRSIPPTEMAQRAMSLARSLGLLDNGVYFNSGWIPYDQRQNYLLDADIGVSTHFDHVETRFAFRTRMLDYLWAGLPVVCTAGDAFADLVAAEELGAVVPSGRSDVLASAILQLLDPSLLADIRRRIPGVAAAYRWDVICERLSVLLDHVVSRAPTPQRRGIYWRYYFRTVREVVTERRGREVLRRFWDRRVAGGGRSSS